MILSQLHFRHTKLVGVTGEEEQQFIFVIHKDNPIGVQSSEAYTTNSENDEGYAEEITDTGNAFLESNGFKDVITVKANNIVRWEYGVELEAESIDVISAGSD